MSIITHVSHVNTSSSKTDHYMLTMDARCGFLSADKITDNYLTLVADTDITTDNRNQHFYASVFTPECKNS